MRGEWASYVLVDRTYFWTPKLLKNGYVFEGLKSSVLKRTDVWHSWQIEADAYNITLGRYIYSLKQNPFLEYQNITLHATPQNITNFK